MSRNPFGEPGHSADFRLDQQMAARRLTRDTPERQRREKERQETLEAAYQKAKSFFDEEDTIQPASFDQYDRRMIERDMAYVAQREAIFAQQLEADPARHEQQKLALILEAIIHEHIELSDWLGPSVSTRKASRFEGPALVAWRP